MWSSEEGPRLEHKQSLPELRRAFTRLIGELTKTKKICLFIDGVDEFAGNHQELASFLSSLASPHIKLVMSSRPIPACISVFKECPSLRLQDLTKSDIITYVEQNFSKRVTILHQRTADDIPQLAMKIQENASVVFLWVRLVVDMLVAGADNCDDIDDLQRKLNVLPKTLEHLYSRIFREMDPLCRDQASEAFQLMRHWRLSCTGQPMQTLNFSFCEWRPNTFPVTAEEAKDRCKLVERRLASRCRGLLEVHTKASESCPFVGTITLSTSLLSWEDQSLVNSTVQYMHRTVEEFLSQPEIWDTICQYRAEQPLDPPGKLAAASLCMFAMEPPGTAALRHDCWQHQRNFSHSSAP